MDCLFEPYISDNFLIDLTMLFWGLFAVGVVMTLLIYFGVVSQRLRYPFLGTLFFFILILSKHYQLDLDYLGFGKSSLAGLQVYIIVTIAGILFIHKSGIRDDIGKEYRNKQNQINSLIFYTLASSPIQEFVFRAFPLAVFMKFGWWPVWYVLFSATAFSLAHVFIRDRYTRILTFGMGLIWAYCFYLFPDLLLVSISHTVMGVMLYNSNLWTFNSKIFLD